MKKIFFICMLLGTLSSFADQFPLDLNQTTPRCGKYKITASSTRKELLKNCTIIDTHNGMVRLFHGTEKLDVTTDVGLITCKFNRSMVNSDGALKECFTTTPASGESAAISVKANKTAASTASVTTESKAK